MFKKNFFLILCFFNTLVIGYDGNIIPIDKTGVFEHTVSIALDEPPKLVFPFLPGEEPPPTIYKKETEVKLTRYNRKTLVLNTRPKGNSTVKEDSSFFRGNGGKLKSIVSRKTTPPDVLNLHRAIGTMIFVEKDLSLQNYRANDNIFGKGDVKFDQHNGTLVKKMNLYSYSGFLNEIVSGVHDLPLLNIIYDTSSSSSICTYKFDDSDHSLSSGTCQDKIQIKPRFSSDSGLLTIIVNSTITRNLYRESVQEDTSVLDDPYIGHVPFTFKFPPQPKDESREKLLIRQITEFCSEFDIFNFSKMQELMEIMNGLTKVEEVPRIPSNCFQISSHMLIVAMTTTKGPLAMPIFIEYIKGTSSRSTNLNSTALNNTDLKSTNIKNTILNETNSKSTKYNSTNLNKNDLNSTNLDSTNKIAQLGLFEEFIYKSLSNHDLISDLEQQKKFFSRPQNLDLYKQIVDIYLKENSIPLRSVVYLLEGLRYVAPDLFKSLLQKVSPALSPAAACSSGNYSQAIEILRDVSGLRERPSDYVSSLKPCFITVDLRVQLATIDSLSAISCQSNVKELQHIILESPSDPEIRIAAYKGLYQCLHKEPSLYREILKSTFNKTSDIYSPQVASYIWSHVNSLLSSCSPQSCRPTVKNLKDSLFQDMPKDPVFYNPRQHSRHFRYSYPIDRHTSVVLTIDVVFSRTSYFPRSFTLQGFIDSNGDIYKIGKINLRIDGLSSGMLYNFGGKELWNAITDIVASLVKEVSKTIKEAAETIKDPTKPVGNRNGNSERRKMDLTQNLQNFVNQIISKMPSSFKSDALSFESYVELFGVQIAHVTEKTIKKSSILRFFKTRSVVETFKNFYENIFTNDFSFMSQILLPFLDNKLMLTNSGGVPLYIGIRGLLGGSLRVEHSLINDLLNFTDASNTTLHFGGGFELDTEVRVDQMVLLHRQQVLGSNIPLDIHRKKNTTTDIIALSTTPLNDCVLFNHTNSRVSADTPFGFTIERRCMRTLSAPGICDRNLYNQDQHPWYRSRQYYISLDNIHAPLTIYYTPSIYNEGNHIEGNVKIHTPNKPDPDEMGYFGQPSEWMEGNLDVQLPATIIASLLIPVNPHWNPINITVGYKMESSDTNINRSVFTETHWNEKEFEIYNFKLSSGLNSARKTFLTTCTKVNNFEGETEPLKIEAVYENYIEEYIGDVIVKIKKFIGIPFDIDFNGHLEITKGEKNKWDVSLNPFVLYLTNHHFIMSGNMSRTDNDLNSTILVRQNIL